MYVILFKHVLFFFFLSLDLFYLSVLAPRPINGNADALLSYNNAITPQTTHIQQNVVVCVM